MPAVVVADASCEVGFEEGVFGGGDEVCEGVFVYFLVVGDVK